MAAHYIAERRKEWITNCGIAGLYTVFAKIDGEKFSAFLVERDTPGLTVGAEEHKLGIRGSSTCPLVLADCKVPAENLLGEAGKGHHIAFNVLNVGRFKLGVACIGGARHALAHMIRYAKERKAFGKPIAEFGLIQRKISTSAARLYAAESMAYRTVGMIDASLAQMAAELAHSARETQKRIEEYAVECSILKVYGSEMLSMVADELVATMGGYGYVEEYPAERYYRDARINRIFEGTNEINRLIITGWLMKRALSGQLPLLPAIKKLMDEVMQPPSFDFGGDADELLAREAEVLAAAKKIALFAAGVASQRFMTGAAGAAGGDGGPGRHDRAGLCAGVGAAAGAEAGGHGHKAARGCGGDDRAAGGRDDGAWRSRRRGGCWRLAARATCCGRNWRFCGGWRGLRRPMRWRLSRTVARHALQLERYPF